MIENTMRYQLRFLTDFKGNGVELIQWSGPAISMNWGVVDSIEEENDNILADMLEDVAAMLRAKKDAVEWTDDTEMTYIPDDVQEVMDRVSIETGERGRNR